MELHPVVYALPFPPDLLFLSNMAAIFQLKITMVERWPLDRIQGWVLLKEIW